MASKSGENDGIATRLNISIVQALFNAYKRAQIDRGNTAEIDDQFIEILTWAEDINSGFSILKLVSRESSNNKGIAFVVEDGEPRFWAAGKEKLEPPPVGQDVQEEDVTPFTESDAAEAVKAADDLISGLQ